MPYINMNQPWIYMCSRSWIPSPASLPIPSLWVIPVHQLWALVSFIQPGLVICFTLDNIHVSMLFSQIFPPSPPPIQYTNTYMKFRKMVTITLYARQKKRHRCTEQTFGLFEFVLTSYLLFLPCVLVFFWCYNKLLHVSSLKMRQIFVSHIWQ